MNGPLEKLSCQELVELVTDYTENTLSAVEHARFEEHLETCEGCRNYVEQMKETVAAVGRLHPDDLSPEAEKALLNAFRSWKRTE